MTAQQQLADAINARGFDAPIIALRLVRDHGPAIAELIEAVSAYMDKPNLQMAGPMGAALRKLTQDA